MEWLCKEGIFKGEIELLLIGKKTEGERDVFGEESLTGEKK